MESDTLFLCQPCGDDGSILHGVESAIAIRDDDDTSGMISEWLQTLTSVKLSDEYWLNDINDRILSSGDEDYTQQISIIAQRLFESLPINNIAREDSSETSALELFPTKEIREAFDTNFNTALQTIIDDEISSRRTSNKHPLKIQFLA